MTKDQLISELRKAVADYMRSEGCSCCRDAEGHDKARTRLGQLLGVPEDGGYHDFTPYESEST